MADSNRVGANMSSERMETRSCSYAAANRWAAGRESRRDQPVAPHRPSLCSDRTLLGRV
jgi:hypothetical protein